MKNKIPVTIFDMEFTLVGEENEEYMRKIAAHVDEKLREVTQNPAYSTVAAAILTAANIADEYYRASENAENLRSQLKEYFEEITRLRDEIALLKRDIARLEPVTANPSGWEERQSKLDLDGKK